MRWLILLEAEWATRISSGECLRNNNVAHKNTFETFFRPDPSAGENQKRASPLTISV